MIYDEPVFTSERAKTVMLSGVTANQGKNNRMMIFDEYRFFRQREGYIAKT